MKKLGTYYLKPAEVGYYGLHPSLMLDGRHVGKISEEWVAELVGGKRQPENFPYDVETYESEFYHEGTRLEVRSAIKDVSFASSKEVGSGRQVTEEGFTEKLDSIDYFVIVDSREWEKGHVVFYEISKDDVYGLGLGKRKSMAVNKFWKKVTDGIK